MEVINSFFNNIKDKLTNPFFGTLIIVLIIHHWELWYTVFNFDVDFTLDDKLLFIKKYVSENLTLNSFLWDIAQAGLYMFLGYLIIVATRSLVLWVEFWLMPFITGKIVNKNVVRKSEYDDAVIEREQYFDQYEEQRKNVRNFSKTIDQQTEQIKLKDKALLEQSESISSSVKELDLTNKKLDKLKEVNDKQYREIDQLNNMLSKAQNNYEVNLEKVKRYEHLYFGSENKNFYSSVESFPPEILNKVHQLKEKNKWLIFLTVSDFFQKGGSIGNEYITNMVKEGMVFEKGTHQELTPIGKVISTYRSFFK